jgi:hypothetical protein
MPKVFQTLAMFGVARKPFCVIVPRRSDWIETVAETRLPKRGSVMVSGFQWV